MRNYLNMQENRTFSKPRGFGQCSEAILLLQVREFQGGLKHFVDKKYTKQKAFKM